VNVTVAALAAEAEANAYTRKRLIASTLGEGREVLRSLGRTRGWLGFEPVTPWILASELSASILAERGLRVADEFEQLALLDDAMDVVIGEAPGFAASLADGAGLRQAVVAAIRELRHTGVDAGLLARTPFRDVAKRDALARVLRRYEAVLAGEGVVDAAGVFRIALQSLSAGTASLPAARYLLLPGLDRRGLAGRLLEHVVEAGGLALPHDTVHGLRVPASAFSSPALEAPSSSLAHLHHVEGAGAAEPTHATVEVFAAGSVGTELREVLRRVAGRGLRWDEVEIVTTDAMTYGAALDVLARRLGVPVSHAAGLPVARTRPGRAIRAYLDWVRDDLPAEGMHALLERGDVASPDGAVSGMALARRLRRLRVGRGRERWEMALATAEQAFAVDISAEDERAPDEVDAARERDRAETLALSSLIRSVLNATPDVPDRLRTRAVPVRPADLARGALALLSHVPAVSAVDATAAARLEKRLGRIAETLRRPTGVDAAVALLEAKLETRVPAPDEAGSAPWSASGGRLHLSDLRHGGWTGRRATFIVGLDSSRFPPGGLQDAVLSDDDRFRLTTGQAIPTLPSSAERMEEARYALAALLARLRGEVTLSWTAWEAAEARSPAPAPEILQAFRLARGNATLDYADLLDSVGVATPVPGVTDVPLDGQDVWLRAIAEGGVLRDAAPVVRAVFPGLDRGLAAFAAREAEEYGPYHGRVAPRAAMDARNGGVVLSASRLEALGTCPLRYFMRTVLRVRPPDTVEMDPDRWLSPLQRGALLHDVYEKTLREARRRNVDYEDLAFEAIALAALENGVEAWQALQPPPGGAVFRGELDTLRNDVLAFVQMVRADAPDWLALELSFGRGTQEPFSLELESGAIRLAGAIDRVDRLADGTLRIVDYKTGSSYRYRQGEPYHGGRRLQHVLYAAVASRLCNADVSRVEYHFPTYRERMERAPFAQDVLRGGLSVIDELLDLAAAGRFHATDAADDCRFCDYRRVCRVREQRGRTTSPAADWTRRSLEREELQVLRLLRGR
jgi:RecB family exonuclease